jgi:hypothetical protein
VSDRLAVLEDLRRPILATLDKSVDDATRSMWRSDADSLFTLLRMAADLERRGARAEMSAAYLIERAQSRCSQVASELHALGAEGERLEAALLAAFAELRSALPSPAEISVAPSAAPIRKISPTEYHLACAVCAAPAVIVRVVTAEPPPIHLNAGQLECAGITRSVGLRATPEQVFAWLDAGDLAALHDYMERVQDIDGGLDAWCPQCALTYCRTHYNVREAWDEGFYDCSRGTCPRGHSRTIDD